MAKPKTAPKKAAPKAVPKEEATLPVLDSTDASVERYAKEAERRTKQAISKTPMVPIWVDPVVNKEGEVLTYRLNGVTYHIKTKQVVMVPEALAQVIYDQARRKKLSARLVSDYVSTAESSGKKLGDLA